MPRKADTSDDVEALAAEIAARVAKLPDRAVPTVRRLRREISKTVRSWPGKSVVKLALLLHGQLDAAPRWLPYEIINEHPDALAALNTRTVKALGRGMSSWYEVDPFACYVAGPAWRIGNVPTAEIHRWARSSDVYWRRAAVVATVALNGQARGGSGDTKRTLAVCEIVKDDRADMIVKALSWALRELARRDSASVRAFLGKHRQTLPARVKREVANKLATGLKNPRRRRS